MKRTVSILSALALVLAFSLMATTPVAAGNLAEGTTFSIVGNHYPVDFTVTDDGPTVTWTFNYTGTKTLSGDGRWNYGLAISLDGVEPAFQIHNNDGTDNSFEIGTHLYSPYLSGWVSGTTNTLVSDLAWVTCTGDAYMNPGTYPWQGGGGPTHVSEGNPDGIFTVTIDKAALGLQFHWAIWCTASGFWSPNTGYSSYPNGFIWGTDVKNDHYELCSFFTPDDGVIEDLVAVAVPPGAPSGVTFPHGMFSFKITGLSSSGPTVTLNVSLPAAVPVGTLWWKYQDGSWYSLPNLSDDGDHIMIISLTDGGSGDGDNIDKQITDDGGPGSGPVGWETSPISKVPVLLPWIALLAAIVAGASLLVFRRRRAQS
jgi:hypothetical protein